MRQSLEHLRTTMMTLVNRGTNLGQPRAWSLLPGLNLGVWSWLDIAFCALLVLSGGHLM